MRDSLGHSYAKIPVLKPNRPEAETVAGHIDDPDRDFPSQDIGEEEICQEEMADVVGGELALDAVDRLGVRRSHDTGVVDNHIDVLIKPVDSFGCFSDVVQRTQVHLWVRTLGAMAVIPRAVSWALVRSRVTRIMHAGPYLATMVAKVAPRLPGVAPVTRIVLFVIRGWQTDATSSAVVSWV